jgi:hypothetical protein
MQQMEMLEDMVLNGASVTSVISIGWNGVGSGSSDDSGGSGSQDDGGLSDEEFQQANAEVMAQLFENINALIAQGEQRTAIPRRSPISSLTPCSAGSPAAVRAEADRAAPMVVR